MKTHNHKTHILALCLGCLIIGLNGCKSKQHIAQTQLTHTPTLHKVVEQTLAASPQFTTAEAAKMTIKIEMEKVRMINYGLKDRVVIITGANNPWGIGATTALAFAREGAKVVLVYKKVFRPFDEASGKTVPFFQNNF